MQTARTEPAEPADHAETPRRWVHSMIDGSAGLPASQVGGKAWNLARLADAGAPESHSGNIQSSSTTNWLTSCWQLIRNRSPSRVW